MIYYGMTDIGRRRESNQDVFYTHRFSNQAGFAMICDGMGGQNGGSIASEMTCSITSGKLIEQRVNELPSAEIRDLMITAIGEANIEVYKKSNLEQGCKGMGTTAVLAVVCGKTAHIANVGDSRAYLLSGDDFRQLTRDHSLVQELLEQGKISQEELHSHPNKNMITRAVGVGLTVNIDYLETELGSSEKLLLCSDGLTNMVSDEQIGRLLRRMSAENACKELIRCANEAGGLDNITVSVIGQED